MALSSVLNGTKTCDFPITLKATFGSEELNNPMSIENLEVLAGYIKQMSWDVRITERPQKRGYFLIIDLPRVKVSK
ncbi:MAG: hypothetical protein WCV55_02740 [Candidatus Paceibacterota bacterium]